MAKLTNTELSAFIDAAFKELGDHITWRHVNSGRLYDFKGVSILEENLTLMVNYSPISAQNVTWSRPLKEFKVKFAPAVL